MSLVSFKDFLKLFWFSLLSVPRGFSGKWNVSILDTSTTKKVPPLSDGGKQGRRTGWLGVGCREGSL